jgi:putative CocE/NonD family hydrolase
VPYAYTYKLHWLGAQHYFQNVDAPKKLLFTGPAHLERPFHQYHDEIIRWYDHWLKGQDTGIMDEPPVRYWLMGANEWRTGTDWPLPETQWTKYYLSHWETAVDGADRDPPRSLALPRASPDVFTQMPVTRTTKVERLRYMTGSSAARRHRRGPDHADTVRGNRSGRHQLDSRAQGRWARHVGSDRARG